MRFRGKTALPNMYLALALTSNVPQAKFRAHHEKRLDEISRRAPGTGTVDNTAPYTSHLKHLKTRPKKKAILAARDAEVERANRCAFPLLVRLSAAACCQHAPTV